MPTDQQKSFNLSGEANYQRWREKKLTLVKNTAPEPILIDDPADLKPAEYQAINRQMLAHNLALFRLNGNPDITNETLKKLGAQLGLIRLDANLYSNESDISELRVIDKGRRGEYIPYTNRPLGWHTDGYYNVPNKTIRSFVLYCISDSETGGENQLMDPELAYIHLRDINPGLVEALMRPDTLTIPETNEADGYTRPSQTSPVFEVDTQTGNLLMRYTQRKTHIKWRDDEITRDALSLLGDLLASDSDHILQKRLKPGEGLICNNVLHNRSGFTDSPAHTRVMLRARYYDRFKEYSDAKSQ